MENYLIVMTKNTVGPKVIGEVKSITVKLEPGKSAKALFEESKEIMDLFKDKLEGHIFMNDAWVGHIGWDDEDNEWKWNF